MVETSPEAARWKRLALLSMFAAGVLHLAIIPEHWSHAPAHGLFFLGAGLLQIAWSAIYWRRPTSGMLRSGFVVAFTLILLWAITRWLPAPFGHGPEHIDLPGLATKGCELICSMALIGLGLSNAAIRPARSAWKTLLAMLALALMLTGVTYGTALAAEPLFPGLAAVELNEHTPGSDDHSHDGQGDQDGHHHD
jgi:hypothetical protein